MLGWFLLLGLIRQPDIQINYGTGKDVSEEAIEDGLEPLEIQWLPGSFIEVPLLTDRGSSE